MSEFVFFLFLNSLELMHISSVDDFHDLFVKYDPNYVGQPIIP